MDVCQEVGGAYRGRYHGTHAAGQPYLGETRGFLIIAAANDAPAAPSCFSSLGIFSFFFHQKSEQSDSGFFSSSLVSLKSAFSRYIYLRIILICLFVRFD